MRNHILFVCALKVEVDDTFWRLASPQQLDSLADQCEDLAKVLKKAADDWQKEFKLEQQLVFTWNNE